MSSGMLSGLGLADAKMLSADADKVERSQNRREAALQFESYLAQIMVREMRKTVPEGMFDGPAMEVFSDMLDEEISQRISKGGRLGLATQLMHQMGEDPSTPLAGRAAAGLSVPYLPGPLAGDPEASPPSGPRARRGTLPVMGRFSSAYGRRTDPFHGRTRNHSGLDIAAPEGASIRAAESGVVVLAGEQGSYGKLIVVEHDDGSQAFYAHCSGLNVAPGQRVEAGQSIGEVGETGRATGPHLHFELRLDGEAVDPVDAYGWE